MIHHAYLTTNLAMSARACILLLALLAPSAQAQSAADALQFVEIAPGVYLRHGAMEVANAGNRGHIANLGVIVGDERVAVIDAGGSYNEGKALLDAVARITDLPVAWLIVTHMHPDHALGAAAFAERGIPVVGHVNLADALSRRRDAYVKPVIDALGRDADGTRVVLPDVTVMPGRDVELDLGGRVLQLRAQPTAHTNNDLTVYDTQADLLWLSDLLFVERIPVVDGSLLGWLAVLEVLSQRNVSRVVPGHGPVPTDWKAAIARQQNYLEGLARGVREVIRRGGGIAQAVASVGLSARDRWELFDEYHGRNVTAAFAELEWE